jgi:hypothetical protein
VTARALSARLRRVEGSLGAACPACAGRPRELPLLFRHEGGLTDGKGHDIDPAWLEPCPRCGRPCGAEYRVRVIEGLGPSDL